MKFRNGMHALKWFCETRMTKQICGRLSLQTVETMIDVDKALSLLPIGTQRAFITYTLDPERPVKKKIWFNKALDEFESILNDFDYLATEAA